MKPGERTTGIRDEHYNLVSVLYHALHGAENCDIYATDAEASGRVEHSDFFREAQETQRELADRAKGLLGIGGAARRAAGGTPAGGATAEGDVPPRSATPGAGGTTIGSDIPTATTLGDIPPQSADIQREPDVRLNEPDVPMEDIPPQRADLHAEEAITPSDKAPPDVDVVPPGRAEVSPDVPRTEEVPPRTKAVPTSEEVLRTEDVSREPDERRPVEEPVEAERRADTGETVQDLIRETSRRSRGEI
jgi:hypothetical protein